MVCPSRSSRPRPPARPTADHEGEYAITNTRSSMDPFLTFSDERELREKVWRTYYSRGDNGDEHDNNALIAEILALRNERVQLLGYDNYAQWRLENRMAKTPERALELMETVWPAAIARVEEEVADMQAIADRGGRRASRSSRGTTATTPRRCGRPSTISTPMRSSSTCSSTSCATAMFFVAGELFNFSFTPVPEGSVPVFHEDVTVWEVTDKTSGDHIGLWYLDPYARPGKRSGAWATTLSKSRDLRWQADGPGSNNSNFIKGAPGEAGADFVGRRETLFHEFGHALHFLSSNVAYPTLNGGVRDYTEFQSQLLERWLLTDQVIDDYLVHHETGEPIPEELVAKIKKAATFNQGFATTEYLASALMDMKYPHDRSRRVSTPTLSSVRRSPSSACRTRSSMRHRSPHFGHIFSGEGYSAGYYGYMWADVLTADAAEAFDEAPGGFYDKELAKKLVEHLFAVRNSVDPADAYRAFRGRDAEMEALMRDRGFPVPEK